MAETNDKRGKRVASGDGNIHKRGDGLGTGPVGNGPRGGSSSGSQSSQSHKTSTHQTPNNTRPSGNARGTSGGGSERSSSGAGLLASLLGGGTSKGTGKLAIALAVVALLAGGGTGISSLLNTSTDDSASIISTTESSDDSGSSLISSLLGYGTSNTSSVLSSLGLSDILGGSGLGSYASLLTTDSSGEETTLSTSSYNTWTEDVNTSDTADETVAKEARDKYTTIKGNKKDTVTVMVYMCGTDLESSYGMGTSDLQEMLASDISDSSNVNLIVYTGGCKKWKNNVVSSSTNQIYQLKDGQLSRLSDNEGEKAMVDPDTLSGYIKYCAEEFPANRYALIFWDHGGGSISGYGYDEKYSSSGSMDLSEISEALKDGGVKFDFVGFDACLMATAETALMLDDYADYMIASEESEPGIGWYYTDWLNTLNSNTSISTVSLGKTIVDSFISKCNTSCKGQDTTLSVIDLAEFAAVVPAKLSAFSEDMTEMINGDSYKTVSTARNKTKEFAESSKIDQIDLVHFAKNMGTDAGNELADALLGAIKYNKTSSTVTNAYGVSIYFPYSSTKYVSTAVKTYDKIGLDSSYSKCIKAFANLETSGQISSGGSSGSMSSLLGMLGGSSSVSDYYSAFTGSSSSSSSSYSSSDMISGLLSSFLSGGRSITIDGLTDDNMDYMTESDRTVEENAAYISENFFDATKLSWQKNADGYDCITLSKEDWSLVTDLALSCYYDDGEGYIDLGIDNIFVFDDDGNLLAPQDVTWMAVCDNMDGENPQAVAFYYETMTDDGTNYSIRGYIPAFVNDQRVRLIVVFDNENPYGYIAGAEPVYTDGETETVAKSLSALEAGDKVDFICDYYTYEGEYDDSYYLGDTMTVPENTEDFSIWSVALNMDNTSLMYRFKDIYNQTYWGEATK